MSRTVSFARKKQKNTTVKRSITTIHLQLIHRRTSPTSNPCVSTNPTNQSGHQTHIYLWNHVVLIASNPVDVYH